MNMKTIIATLFLLTALPAARAVTIPMVPTDIVVTSTVDSVDILFFHGENWITVVRSYIDENGRYGKFIGGSGMMITPVISSGNTCAADGLAEKVSNLRVTGEELDAAGDALGITWVTANGNDELAVMLYAFVTKLANELGQDQAWISGVVQSIQAEIFGQ